MTNGAVDTTEDFADDAESLEYEGGAFDGGFALGALERAQAAVERLKEAYVAEWGPAALDEMYEAMARLGRTGVDGDSAFQCLYRLAHDMKGQGGTFGFPLLTHIGEALCRMTAGRREAGESDLRVLRAHLDAARTILVDRIEGDGGAAGDRLVRDLQTLARQHLH